MNTVDLSYDLYDKHNSKNALIIANGLFGPVVSEDASERMGDLIAIANDDLILIDPARVKEESSMVGHHGGITDIEVEIPLLLT